MTTRCPLLMEEKALIEIWSWYGNARLQSIGKLAA